MLVFAIVVLVLSLGAFGGVYGYEVQLRRSITGPDGLRQSLTRVQELFEGGLLEEIARFDTRIKRARTLLNNHTTLAPLFALLEEHTLKTVRFNTFDFSSSESGAHIRMDGTAQSFSSVALQSDSFVANKRLRNVSFSNVQVKGNSITFQFSAMVDPDLLRYTSVVSR